MIIGILASRGPATLANITGHAYALGHPLHAEELTSSLDALVERGLAETRTDTFAEHSSTIWWPTMLGRAQAEIDAQERARR